MAVKEVNVEELFVFSGCCFGKVAISDRFEESWHVLHFISSMSCECRICTGLSLDLVSSPQSLDTIWSWSWLGLSSCGVNQVAEIDSTCLLDLKIIQCGLM